jgi:indolepyruvate ferredoxin oxidoreductase
VAFARGRSGHGRYFIFHTLADYELGDRYTKISGRVFMTGTQALVRVALDQARRDKAGAQHRRLYFRLSRLAARQRRSRTLARQKPRRPARHQIPAGGERRPRRHRRARFPAGRDQPGQEVQGVFAMWYGKGPGVDRAGDALKHGNAYGSSPHGGVLVVAGDDHGCMSSSMPHQSDVAFMAWFMPTLNPSSVGEYLAFGEYGYALSRYSGMWVGFKAISETVESGQSVEVPAPHLQRA